MKFLVILFMNFLLTTSVFTQNSNYNSILADSLGADEYGMKSYVLVILKTGNDTITDQTKRSELFKGHMANIKRLADEKKLIVAGPLGKNDKTYLGIFIFDVKTIEEAKALTDSDPAVQAGIFDMEIIEWYGSAALPMYLKYSEKVAKTQF